MIIGHKGAAGYAPENTLASLRKGIEMGLKFVEIDVQLTKDHEVVVIHDYSLNRTTNGNGFVKAHTLSEIKKFDAGSWYGDAFQKEEIPTLEEVLKILPKDVWLNIEIKNIARERANIEEKILELINRYEIEDQIVISSFDHLSLNKVRSLNKTIKIGVLLYAYLLDPWSQLDTYELKPYSIHPAIEYLDEAFVDEAKKRGYKVFPYTVNTIEEYAYCMYLGVDGVFSDYPDLAMKDQ